MLIQDRVKSQVCENCGGQVWIKTGVNSLSYCKWDVLCHTYGRRIMWNEFHVILMILLSFSLMWLRMKTLVCVKSPLILTLPCVQNHWPWRRLQKSWRQAQIFFSSLVSCQPPRSFSSPQHFLCRLRSAKTFNKHRNITERCQTDFWII